MRNSMGKILKWIFLLLMGVQTILGIGWIFANADRLPLFQESVLLSEAVKKGSIDEYMGILYPLLMQGTQWLAHAISVPYYSILYVIQLICAAGATMYLLRYMGWRSECIRERILYAFLMGYLLTFPLLLQMHMAVLPYSLTTSVMTVLVCDGLYSLKHPEKMNVRILVRMCILWCLSTLLLPDYGWLAGIFTVGVMSKIWLGNKALRMRIAVGLLSTIVCFGLVSSLTQTPGSMGRIQKTVGASLMHRFVWPNFGWDYFFWNDDIKEILDYDQMEGISKYTEEVIYRFGPAVEEAYGLKEAESLYLDMAVTALEVNTKQILSAVGTDMAAYLCPPIALQYQKAKNSSSVLGWNYGQLQEEMPLLTKYYTRMAFGGWNVLFTLGVCLVLSQKRKDLNYGKVLLIICTLFMAGWYTMRGAGMQDYKNVMLISLLWLVPVVSGFKILKKIS